MKKIIFILTFFFSYFSYAGDSVVLGNGDWPPYLSEKMKEYGWGSKIVTKAFAKAGIDVKYGFYPWGRSYELGKRGRYGKHSGKGCCDGTLLWRSNEERLRDFYVSDTVLSVGYVFFSLKKLKTKQGIDFDKFPWISFMDVSEFTIGTSLDYSYGEEFTRLQKNKTLYTVQGATDLKNLKALLAGTIQIFPLPQDVGLTMIKENFRPDQRDKFTYNPKEFAPEELCLLLSKADRRNAVRIELFNEGLKKLKKSGEFDKIAREFRMHFK